MGKFSIGDRAEVLDEAISGVIQKVDGDRVTLITEDGFPMHFTENDLVKMNRSKACAAHLAAAALLALPAGAGAQSFAELGPAARQRRVAVRARRVARRAARCAAQAAPAATAARGAPAGSEPARRTR